MDKGVAADSNIIKSSWYVLIPVLFFFQICCADNIDFIAGFLKPCPGDPFNDIQVTPTPVSGIKGGTFGCARQGDNDCSDGVFDKWHDGLDLTARLGSPLFAMYDGEVIDRRISFFPGQYKANSFGNYVTVLSNLPSGNTIILKFNHLNSVFASTGRNVKAGEIIALTGNTGNAASDEVIPHVHIQALDLNWNSLDPRNFLATKIDENGRVIDHCKN